MKQSNDLQQAIAVSPLLTLAVTALASPSPAASQATHNDIQLLSPTPLSIQKESKNQLVQDPANCRRVVTLGRNLNVRSSPGGTIISSLPNKTLVTIESRSVNGWVRISSPVSGYISARYVKLCAEPTPPSSTVTPSNNYRRVIATAGLRVRQEPSINSPILGYLANGQRITIVNRGANGWVPISSPIQGYVSAAYLKY